MQPSHPTFDFFVKFDQRAASAALFAGQFSVGCGKRHRLICDESRLLMGNGCNECRGC